MEKEQRVQPAWPLWQRPPWGKLGLQKLRGRQLGRRALGTAPAPWRRGDLLPRLAGDREIVEWKGNLIAPAEITAAVGCLAGVPCLLCCVCSFPLSSLLWHTLGRGLKAPGGWAGCIPSCLGLPWDCCRGAGPCWHRPGSAACNSPGACEAQPGVRRHRHGARLVLGCALLLHVPHR